MSLNETVNVSYNKKRSYKTVSLKNGVIFCWMEKDGFMFRCVGEEPLTEDKAQLHQEKDFSLPTSAHGFYKFSTKIVDGLFISSWYCHGSLEQ